MPMIIYCMNSSDSICLALTTSSLVYFFLNACGDSISVNVRSNVVGVAAIPSGNASGILKSSSRSSFGAFSLTFASFVSPAIAYALGESG